MDKELECRIHETQQRLDKMQSFLENYFDVDMDRIPTSDYRWLYRTHHERAERLKIEMDHLEFILKQRAEFVVQE
jgi:hypothetical protein